LSNRCNVGGNKLKCVFVNTICYTTFVLSPLKIPQSATINPGEDDGLDGVMGQVKEGFEADLLVLESNPLEDIEVMERVDSELLAVLKGARVFSSKIEGVDAVMR
jgi:imidazolonepropionase-like amidohydrolase